MTVEATPVTPEAYTPPELDDNFTRQLDAAYSLSPEQFLALKVAERDLCLFLLLREVGGTLRSMELRFNELEEKAKELGTPEGVQELMSKFLGGMGGGGLGGFGSLLR
jgi:hypothetical protein